MERNRGRVRRSGREVIGGGRQGGLTLGGLLVAGFLIIVAAIVGMKIVPTVIEYYSLKNILVTMANDPELRDDSERDIRVAYVNRAQIADITVVQPHDILISQKGGALRLSTAYSVKVHLMGNVSACLDFEIDAGK